MQLKGQVAIITGASRGIGKAVALKLAKDGCNIVIAAKTDEPNPKLPGTIHDTAKEVEALGVRALPLKVNVREEAEVDLMVKQTLEAFGRIDILINNAGAIFWANVADHPVSRFDLVMDVNARAAFLCSRAVLPTMIEQKRGHIVMMSPPVSTTRVAGKAPYLLSKMGMTFFAHAIAEENREHNVSACALWPVTMVESQATIHFGMGEAKDWRKADILADATHAIVTAPHDKFTGRALYDEDVLRESGVSDFAPYSVVPGSDPAPLCRALVE
ncbi:MAG: SDR family oxidoreductase [Myxococcales bacterium]